jgi:UDP-N-acetylmuramyl-tripeptide synthetase
MEVSSHALAQNRVLGCEFDSVVFTNLTQDHLDFHEGIEEYFAAKLRLFSDPALHGGKATTAAVNADDPRGGRLVRATQGRVLTYGVRDPLADVRATEIAVSPCSVSFRLNAPCFGFPVRLAIGGAFQVYNALAAATAAIGLGIPAAAIADGLSGLRSSPGRFESVPNDRGFHVIVDYAHTPDGLDNVLRSARELGPSRLIVVFGCGGNRDRTKRKPMGEIATRLADRVFVTSDNPRDEEPLEIISQIEQGLAHGTASTIEPDRRAAIGLAIAEARPGDVVVIAGKGHEDYQLVRGQALPFDDRKVAAEFLGTVL